MPRSKNSKRKKNSTVDDAEQQQAVQDDVEAVRSAKRRRQDRESRDTEEEGETQQPIDYEAQRKQRMQRLRQELQEEDQEMAEKLDEARAAALPEAKDNPQGRIVQINEEELEGLDPEEQMRKLMGIDGFGSTKGQKVDDNFSTSARGVVQKNKARKYRQYMNRKNGFNRPLEKMK